MIFFKRSRGDTLSSNSKEMMTEIITEIWSACPSGRRREETEFLAKYHQDMTFCFLMQWRELCPSTLYLLLQDKGKRFPLHCKKLFLSPYGARFNEVQKMSPEEIPLTLKFPLRWREGREVRDGMSPEEIPLTVKFPLRWFPLSQLDKK